jgi:hypothetical protein
LLLLGAEGHGLSSVLQDSLYPEPWHALNLQQRQRQQHNSQATAAAAAAAAAQQCLYPVQCCIKQLWPHRDPPHSSKGPQHNRHHPHVTPLHQRQQLLLQLLHPARAWLLLGGQPGKQED